MTLSCRKAAELASRSLDQTLPWRERLALRLHTFICRVCRRYVRQLELLRRAVNRLAQDDPLSSQAQLSPEARSRIRDTLLVHTQKTDPPHRT